MPVRSPRSAPPRGAAHATLRALLLAAALLLPAALAAPAAHAGAYTAWSCKTPTGQRNTTTDGWTGSSNMPYNSPANTCATGGDLYANFGGPDIAFTGGQAVRFVFNAPADTTITHVTANRQWIVTRNGAGDSQGGAGIGIYRGAMIYDAPYVVEQCLSFQEPQCYTADGDVSFDVPSGLGGQIGFDTGCYGPPQSATCSGSAQYGRSGQTWRWAKIELKDDLAPTVTGPAGGTLTESRPLTGSESLSVPLADKGSGLLQGVLLVNGAEVGPRSGLDANGGKCAEVNVDPANPYEYGTPTPCKASLTAAWNLDTTKFAEGDYRLQAVVWDAAGNTETVFDKRVTIQRPDEPAPTITFAKAKATIGYGKKFIITGRVTDAAGRGMPNVALAASRRVSYAGAATKALAQVSTDEQGNFDFAVTGRASSAVTVSYTRQGRTTPATTATFALKVRGKLDFRATRTKLRHGSVARFSGTLRNAPLAKKGARVVIEVQLRGKWRPAEIVKTSSKGAFTWSRRLTAVTTYRFRARLERSSDVPAEPAVSRTVAVRLT